MSGFDAILFDFDGVLIDSEPLHCACWAAALAPLGVKLEWDIYRARYMGVDDRDMLCHIAAGANPPLDWEMLWARYPVKKELFQREMQRPQFVPGLSALLDELHPDYKLAVVSSSARLEIEPPLVLGNLRGYFGALIAGEDVEHLKPAPDPYLLAARLLSAQKPLVVEDSPAGITSGRAAGFEVLAVSSASSMAAALLDRLSGRSTTA